MSLATLLGQGWEPSALIGTPDVQAVPAIAISGNWLSNPVAVPSAARICRFLFVSPSSTATGGSLQPMGTLQGGVYAMTSGGVNQGGSAGIAVNGGNLFGMMAVDCIGMSAMATYIVNGAVAGIASGILVTSFEL